LTTTTTTSACLPRSLPPSLLPSNPPTQEELAERMLEKFEKDWVPAMEALEAAEEAFDDVDPLLEGPEGFDAAQAVRL